jgi:hypothetical protein
MNLSYGRLLLYINKNIQNNIFFIKRGPGRQGYRHGFLLLSLTKMRHRRNTHKKCFICPIYSGKDRTARPNEARAESSNFSCFCYNQLINVRQRGLELEFVKRSDLPLGIQVQDRRSLQLILRQRLWQNLLWAWVYPAPEKQRL